MSDDLVERLQRGHAAPMTESPNLRAATEDDVARALDGACIALPITTPAAALELYNRMLDVLGVPDEDGDVFVFPPYYRMDSQEDMDRFGRDGQS